MFNDVNQISPKQLLPKEALVFSLVGFVFFNLLGSLYLNYTKSNPSLAASLQINKTVSNASPNTGESFFYTIQYRCASLTDDCLGTVITDPLPASIEFISVSGSSHTTNASYNSGTHTVSFTFVDPLPAGTSGQVQIQVRFPNGTSPNGVVASNTATMSATNASSANSSVNVTAVANDRVQTHKYFNGGVLDEITVYGIEFCNNTSYGLVENGTLNPTAITIIDTLPAGTVFSAANHGGVYNAIDHSVTWTYSDVPLGECVWPQVYLTFPSSTFSTGDYVVNNATVNYTPTGGTPISVPVSVGFNIATAWTGGYLNKDVNDDSMHPGQSAYYEFSWNNWSNVPIDNFYLQDTFPDDVRITEFNAGEFYANGIYTSLNLTLSYTTNLNSTLTPLPGAPYALYDNPTFDVSTLGFAANEYITKLRWDFGPDPMPISAGLNQNNRIRVEFDLDNNASIGAMVNCLEADGVPAITYNIGAGQVCETININAYLSGFRPGTRKDYLSPSYGGYIYSSTGDWINPGDTIEMRLRIRNSSTSGEVLPDPAIADLLPIGMEYIAGTWTFDESGSGFAPPVFTQTPNYNGSGRELLKWDWTGDSLPRDEQMYIIFDVRITENAPTGENALTNEYAILQYDNQYCSTSGIGGRGVDTYDLDGDGNTTEEFCFGETSLDIVALPALESEKLVKGQLDTTWTKYPNTGYTVPGGLSDYQLTVKNTGNVDLDSIIIIDILPFTGDTGVIDLSARNSRWRPNLVGAVSAPAGVTVYYSTEGNPCRSAEQIVPLGPASCSAANWTITPPSDITTVQSLKFAFGATVLSPNDSLILEWPMRAPVNVLATIGAQPDSIAWNSFGYIGQRVDNNEFLLPTEPVKVGIAMNVSVPAVIGDFVWVDDNQNGRQNGGELGYDGMRIELFKDNGDGIANPTIDTFVNFTVTADGGFYLFPYLAVGDYFLVFYKPAPYAVTSANTGGNDALDSDGTLATYNGHTVATTPVTNLSGTEYDLDWDLGIYPNGLAAVGNYVWSDVNGDGIQNESTSEGINGVIVNLYNNSAPSTIFATDTTSNDINGNPGYYLFDQIIPADYFIEFVMPTGTTFATQGSTGTSDPTDSDANSGTGRTEVFAIAANTYNDTWDAALILSGVEVCGNGIDDDGDGFTDDTDPDCGCGITISSENIGACINDSLTLTASLEWLGGGNGTIQVNVEGVLLNLDLSTGLISPYLMNIRVPNDGTSVSVGMTLNNGAGGCSGSINVTNTCTEDCSDGYDNDANGLIDCYDCDACYSNPACNDNDNDGVGDYCDLDDDNDGIPDADEANSCVLAGSYVENNFFSEDFGASTAISNSPYVQLCYEDGTNPCGAETNQLNDGEYTIADTPRKLNSNADWTGLGDHTGNTNGRMLVANADLNPDTFYVRPISGFIKNVNVTGSFWARNTIIPGTNILKPNINARITTSTGTTLASINTGDLPEDETWYEFTISANPGNADIVYLILMNVGPGGSGNDLAIDDIAFSQFVCDCDGDLVANHLDLDSDNDGIYDVHEAGHSQSDSNNDGVIDNAITGSGANGLFDGVETSAESGILNYSIADSEASPDGIPDICELDSDGDTCFDADEENVNDPDNDGIAGTGVPTVDANGAINAIGYSTPSINYWQNPIIATCLIEDCSDNIDNDGDGLIDCNDPDCNLLGTSSNWFFGQNAALNFENSTGPIQISPSSMNTDEGCASISDETGNLLFYTDGINIWNREHSVMPNGGGLSGHPSSTQSGVIVPDPANSNRYYVFSLYHQVSNAYYTLVDMTLDSGRGDVVTGSKDINIPGTFVEKLAAWPHANGTDYWVNLVTSGNRLRAYPLTASGLGTPVESTLSAFDRTFGQMKFNADGSIIALASYPLSGTGQLELYDFDKFTGAISNARIWSQEQPYGLEFSPNNELLYVTQMGWGATAAVLYQYQLQGNSTAISASRTTILTASSNYYFASLQLGPDSKIYMATSLPVAHLARNGLHVINAPDNIGAASNPVEDQIIFTGGAMSRSGLPNFPSFQVLNARPTINYVDATDTCLGTTQLLGFSANANAYQWLLNGSPIVGATNAVYTPTVIGDYQVIAFFTCASDTSALFTPIVCEEICGNGIDDDFDGQTDCDDPDCIISPAIISPNTACINEVISIVATSPGDGATYNWNFGTNASPATATGIGPHNVSYTSCGNKTVSLTALRNGCSITVDSIISIIDNTDPIWGNSPQNLILECNSTKNLNDSITLWLSNDGYGTASDNCSSLRITNNYAGLSADCGSTGSTTVQFTAIDSCGNTAIAAASIQILDTQAPEISAVRDTMVDCENIPSPPSPTITDSCDITPDLAYQEVFVYHPNPSWKSTGTCDLLYEVSNGVYDDKGTPATGDDEMTFMLTLIGQNTGASWSATANGNPISGDYYTSYQFGPFLSNGPILNFTVSDTSTPSCTITVEINAANF